MEEGDLLEKQNQNEKSIEKSKKKMVLVKKGPFVVYFRNDATQTFLLYFVISGLEHFAFTPVPSSSCTLYKGIWYLFFSPRVTFISPLFSQCLSLLSLLV